MITPQGGPTYINRQNPMARPAPTLNPFNPVAAAGGINRPNPLYGWAPNEQGGANGQLSWPTPGEIPPGSKGDPTGITPPFISTASGQKSTGGLPTPQTPPFQWPPQGQGPSTPDTVPAWLSPGESVLTPGASQAAGRGNINNLNQQYPPAGNKTGQAVTGYRMGGQVPPGIVPPFAIARAANAAASRPWLNRYTPSAVAQHYHNMQAPQGYDGGIGYVPPSAIDPTQQNVQLSAPAINALGQKAVASGMNPLAVRSLIQAIANVAKQKQSQNGVDSSAGYYGMSQSPGTGY